MDWQDEYRSKFISPDEAAAFVKSGDMVVFTMGREALAAGLAIAARKEELKDVTIFSATPTYDFGWYDDGWQDSFNLRILMPTATCQDAVDHRRLDVDPGTWVPGLEVTEAEACDVLLAEVSPPDDKGFCSFGASLWNKRRQVESAKLVIAEVNDNLIRTYGDNYVHVSEIDYFVEHIGSGGAPGTGTLAGRAVKEPEPYLKDIAGYVNSLIPDRACLQIGVGRTTEPLVGLGILDGKQDIGFHSEATPQGIITRVKEGQITGKYKNLHTGKVVVTSIGGSTRAEMEWVHENPLFYLVDVAYLEDVRIIGAHDNFVALNNALMVDFSGQIASQSIGLRRLSAAGGQIPFVFGAWLSKGGKAIIVLPATAGSGTISRIVPVLPEGTTVTIQSNVADYVVTEYGIAKLRGKSMRQRAEALIGIAHPDHRSELWKVARKMLWP